MRLSVIVCAYNMARELPRTLHTMSTSYQTGVEEGDYEIIVVDNGSAPPVDEHALRSIAGNVHVRTVQVPNRSPAPALNAAVAQARGEMIGLFIDGARMLSPGIFGMALDIHRFDRDCVVGTTAFHLGPDVQMVSVRNGYDQAAEDRLLETVPWKTDGYSLFGISVLAGSSRAGWFGCIAESNGVFMGRERWERIGGLDERVRITGRGVREPGVLAACRALGRQSPVDASGGGDIPSDARRRGDQWCRSDP